jgi:hypothetical protein
MLDIKLFLRVPRGLLKSRREERQTYVLQSKSLIFMQSHSRKIPTMPQLEEYGPIHQITLNKSFIPHTSKRMRRSLNVGM